MYKPAYSMSEALVANIGQIERFYGQIEALKVPQKLELTITRRNLVKSSYASNRIEGNPLSLIEVTNLLLGDRVPVNRDEKEVVNYFNLLKKLPEYVRQPLSLPMVKEFHKLLMTGVDEHAGEIRDVPVVVGRFTKEQGDASLKVKHNPPYHERKLIESHLNELLDWANGTSRLPGVIAAGVFHHEFVYLHPFEDGNGRVCRLFTALIFMKLGYEINRYFVLDDYYDIDRQQYSDSLHTADPGDKTEWLEYFSDGVKYSMQSALAKFTQAIMSLRAEERLTRKEQEVLKIIQEKSELTSNDLVESLKVSRQQAHNLLRALVDKGLVEKKGKTKSSYYSLK